MLKIDVIGNLGDDATVKDINGRKYIAFNVAHNETYTDNNGTRQEKVIWISVLKSGESEIVQYLKKGTKVFVRGNLTASIYDYKGNQGIDLKCMCNEIQLF